MTDKYDPYWPTGLSTALVFLNMFMAVPLIVYSTLLYYGDYYIPTLMMYSFYPILVCAGLYWMLTLHPREILLRYLQIFLGLVSFIVLCLYLNELAGSNSQKYNGTYLYPKLKSGSILSITAVPENATLYSETYNVPELAWLVGFVCVALGFSMVHFFMVWKFVRSDPMIPYSDSQWPEFAQYMDPWKIRMPKFKIDTVRYGASVLAGFIFAILFFHVLLSFWLLDLGYILLTPFPNLLSPIYVLLPFMLLPPSNVSGSYKPVLEPGQTEEDLLRYDEIKSRGINKGVRWRQHVYLFFLFLAIVNCIAALVDTNAWRDSNGIVSIVGQCNNTAFANVINNNVTLDYFTGLQRVTYTVLISRSRFNLGLFATMNCIDDWLNIVVISLASIILILHLYLYKR